jgi:serine/threonine protein kinase
MGAPNVYGSYQLIERLGVGGMAEVFFARSSDPALADRALVVKRMLPELAQNKDAVTLFLDEARLGALLKHRHIVEILDVGELGGSWYMAMSFVDGPDLGKLLRSLSSPRELSATLAAFVVARAATGLHFAHSVVHPATGEPLAVIHRDVSPQNILVDRAGVVRLADFGVARSRMQLHRTQPGHTKGKVGYMSPEQLDNAVLDARSDVRALGVVLWEALTHRRLYGGLNDVQTMFRITAEDPPPMASVGAVVDHELEEIVARAVVRDRNLRFATAAELAEALDDWSRRQPHPPTEAQLAAFVDARVVPATVIDGIPTQWAFRNMTPAGVALDDPEATELDVGPGSVPRASPGVWASPSSPAERPAPALRRPPPPALLHDAVEPPSSASSPSMPNAVGAASKFVPAGRPRPFVRPATSPTGPALPPPGLASLSSSSLSSLSSLSSSLSSTPSSQLVLYVEDEPENRRVAELLLKKHFSLLLAPDDETACAIVRERGNELAAVLMDIQLKGSALDGIALVRLLRGGAPGPNFPGYARDVPRLSVPIFFVTAYAARYGEQELLAVGGDKLVTKPVDFHQLTMALTSFLLRRAAALPRNG